MFWTMQKNGSFVASIDQRHCPCSIATMVCFFVEPGEFPANVTSSSRENGEKKSYDSP